MLRVCLLLAMLSAPALARRAMWLWQPAPPAEAIPFARERGVTDIFLQWSPGADPIRLRAFLKSASAAGIAIHALDGWPEAALAENHAEVLEVIDAIHRFNQASSPNERFAGVHLDIEPYLLAGFEGSLREEILRDFVRLQEKIAAKLSGKRLPYGADLPFWFDDAALEHVLRHAQNVGIMDYRNQALSSDGIVAHGRKWIAAGERLKTGIWIAVETAPAPASETRLVASFDGDRWQRLASRDFPALRLSRFHGFRLRVVQRDLRWHMGLETPTHAARTPAFEKALAGLRDLATRAGAVPEDARSTSPALPKITFHEKTLAEFEREVALVNAEFGASPYYIGLAIHDYEAYRQMK